MKKLILELNHEHELIDHFLHALEQLISKPDFHQNLLLIQKQMEEFYRLTLRHHEREEKILYPWMVNQNSESDKELIGKIIADHRNFEKIVLEINKEITAAMAADDSQLGNLGYNISDLITKYLEHAERESSFIFLIAESLSEVSAH